MQLSFAQKLALLRDGYVIIPGVVPAVMIDAALRKINHSVGQGMDVESMPILRSRSYCPEIQNDPAISDLFNRTPAFSLVESALGEGTFDPASGGQIALRFPLMTDPPPPPRPHLDGMYSPTNGVPKGEIHNFTALVGVLLNDLSAPYSGNFTVWPGTHHRYEQYFREHGPESLLDGMPPIDMPEPVQIEGRAGDIVITHYQIAHAAAPNCSPHVRYGIYFRISKHGHRDRKLEVMTNIWLEWEGLREQLAQLAGIEAEGDAG